MSLKEKKNRNKSNKTYIFCGLKQTTTKKKEERKRKKVDKNFSSTILIF